MLTAEQLFTQLESGTLAVVATTQADAPEAAVVAFTPLADRRLVFATNADTRKFANLQANPRVAVVIGWDGWTVQLEGRVRVASQDEVSELERLHIARNPASAKYAGDTNQRYLVVTPAWARLTDYRGPEAVIQELDFDHD